MKVEYVFPIISTSLWGISITGAKVVGNYGYSAIEITFGRFALASLIFLPLLVYYNKIGKSVIPKNARVWLYLTGLALTGVAVNNSVFYMGLNLTNASVASLLVSLTPLTTMLFAVVMLGEKFSRRKAVSIILGMVGVALIIGFDGDAGQLIGNLLVVLAITIWGSSFSFSRKSTDSGLSSVAVTGISEILGTLLLVPLMISGNSWHKFEAMDSEVIFWFLFMGVLSSVLAYIMHYRAIAVLGASTVAPSTNIIPFSGVIAAWFVLGEEIKGYPFIGVLLILIGVFLVQTEGEWKKQEDKIPSI